MGAEHVAHRVDECGEGAKEGEEGRKHRVEERLVRGRGRRRGRDRGKVRVRKGVGIV